VSEVRLPAAVVCFAVSVLACWFGGFAKLGYHLALLSIAVFPGALGIPFKSAVLSLAISLFLARKNLRMHWEVALSMFVAVSLCYARWTWCVGVFSETLRNIGGR
jgi:hypothetical protein